LSKSDAESDFFPYNFINNDKASPLTAKVVRNEMKNPIGHYKNKHFGSKVQNFD